MRRRQWMATAGAVSAWPAGVWALPGGPASAEQPSARKVLRLSFPTPEASFDPTQTNSDLNSGIIISHILESPLGYDYLARPVQLVARTASRLPEISSDGKTITVSLRPGIYFADDPAFKGRRRELVAQDYVYTIKRFYDPQYNSSDLYLFETAKLPGLAALREQAIRTRRPFNYDTEVEGVRALDRYTLRIVLGQANPRFVYLLADSSLVGAVAREVVEYYGPSLIGEHPVGTGPFRLKSWRRASRIVLERSTSFRAQQYVGTPAPEPWAQAIAARLQGKTLPLVDEVEIHIVEEAQPRWLSFLQGDYAALAVPPEYVNLAAPGGQLAPFLQKRGVRLLRSVQPLMAMSYFFMEDPVVGGYTPDKVALRRAVGLAFDNPSYIRHVLGGQAIPAQSTIAPFTSGYDPSYVTEMSQFDPAKAQALLDLYGYVDRNGDGWRDQPNGQPLVLRMASLGSTRDRMASELWKRSMNRVGIRIEFEIATWPELLKRSRAGTLMMWGYSWSAGSPDGGFFLGIAYGPNASESNDPRFRLNDFDRLYEAQMRLPDGPERLALMRKAQDTLVAYLPFKVHGHAIANDLVQPWLHNYQRHPFMRDVWMYWDVR